MICPSCHQVRADDVLVCPRCPVAAALPPGTRLYDGAFRVERVLGQGGFGYTYLATEVMLDRPVAIKEFCPQECLRQDGQVVPGGRFTPALFLEARTRFIEEARHLARFRHPGIVAVHSLFEANNTAYMVMEFLAGQTLDQRLRQQGSYDLARALKIGVAVGQALKAVHDNGILHRDIKPDNILETDDGRIVLIDFGTARGYLDVSRPMTTILTPAYAPIEQYTAQGHQGPATDIYALGATLYELLTGTPPPEATERAAGRALVSLSNRGIDIPAAVARVVDRALDMDPGARFQQVPEFLEALSAGQPRAGFSRGLEAVQQQVLRGHKGIVKGVALSPDGAWAATASEDRTVRLWGPRAQTLSAHTGWVSAVSFSGDMLWSGSHDKTILGWDVATGTVLVTLAAEDAVLCLAVSPDGERVAGGLQNRRAQAWQGGEPMFVTAAHPGPVASVTLSTAGDLLATVVSGDCDIRLWDGLEGATRGTLCGHQKPVRCVSWSPTLPLLASGSADGSVLLWDVPARAVARVLGAGRKPVVALGWGAEDRLLVARRDTVDAYEASTGRLILTFQGHSREMTAVAASADGRLGITGSADETAILWAFQSR